MKKTSLLISALALITAIFVMGCKQPSTPETPPAPEKSQDQLAVETAIGKLNIPKEISADITKIELPAKVDNVAVKWESNNTDVITTDGTVIHKDEDKNDTVKLKATLTLNKITATKDFEITVKNQMNPDRKLLQEVINKLQVAETVEDDTDIITLPSVPTDEKYKDIKISWVTSNKDIITNTGTVTHKDSINSDSVVLTAILTLNDKAIKKEFTVTVKNKVFTDEQKTLKAAINSFSLNSTAIEDNKNNITLPNAISGNTDIKIEWTSSNSNIINASDGTVKHSDKKESDIVILTATFTLNQTKEKKDFKIEVKNKLSDKKLVELAANDLKVASIIEENKETIYLQTQLWEDFEGITISWVSDKPDIINPNTYPQVKHTPKAGDQEIKLTATIKKGTIETTKVFKIIVRNPTKTPEEIQIEKDTNSVNAVRKALSIDTEIKEHIGKIDLPQKLYGDDFEGVTITWQSDKTDIIANDGKVTHTSGAENQNVILTATITKGDITGTKTFTVTVKNPAKAPEESEILGIAVQTLEGPVFKANTEVSETITLPAELDVIGKKVTVSWEPVTTDTKHFALESNTLTLTRDIGDVTGKVKATLKYGEKSSSKGFDVVIPAFTKFDNADQWNPVNYYEFKSGNILERYWENSSDFKGIGSRYSYTNLNMDKGTINLKRVERYENNQWINIEAENQLQAGKFTELENKINIVEAYPTIPNLLAAMNAYSEASSLELLEEDDLYRIMIMMGAFAPAIQPEYSDPSSIPSDIIALAKLSDEKTKTKAVKTFLEGYKAGVIGEIGLPENSSWNDIITAAKTDLLREEPTVEYSYKIIDKKNISINYLYDSTKQWYEQNGYYEENKNVNAATLRLYGGNTGSFNYYYTGSEYRNCDITLNSDKNSFSAKYKDYSSGPGNATEKDDGTWTVTPSNEKHFITVSKEGIKLELEFKGSSF